uniref:hypothetical protein n=1 Tax=Nonomuraea sp. CA-251285 TaxID=3240002 RepID=UPI003F492EA8
MTGPEDDVDVDYRGILTDSLPSPLLYLSTRDPRGRDLIVPIVKRYGLPILRIEGPEDAATLMVGAVEDRRWHVLLGPGPSCTAAACPRPADARPH